MTEVFDKWKIAGYDRPAAVELCRSGINPLLSVILSSRGITDVSTAEELFADNIESLPDPFLLPDMHKAVDRITRALDNNEKIAVYGDYDVDGMTSATAMALYLKSRGADCKIYIPDRFFEGYGINTEALDALSAEGVTLIISVDCGITAIDEALYAAALGTDMVITDHHEARDQLPNAAAVVDPKCRGCNYPNKHLAGVGVVFKLICALGGVGNTSRLLDEYGDLVALGTVADVVRLQGENRLLVRRGIEVLNNTTRPGLRALIREAHFEGRVMRSNDVGFFISPRINAAGRMGRSSLSVELMMTTDEIEAEALSSELCALNAERKRLVGEMLDEAAGLVGKTLPRGPIVLSKTGWFQGVTGIVASRLVTRCCLPVVMISVDDGIGRGSCRSCGDFNMYAALIHCSDLLISYGGHEMAAGFSIEEKNIGAFRQKLTDYYNSIILLPPAPTLSIDLEVIKPGLLSLENVEALTKLEPFGDGNPRPVLCMRRAMLSYISPVGGGQHTRLRVSKNGESFDCIAFGRTIGEIGLKQGDTADLAFELYVNTYRGHSSVQFILTDISRPDARIIE